MLEKIVALGLLSLVPGAPPSGAVPIPPPVASDTADDLRPPPDWQQGVHYTVEARLEEEDGTLRAAQTVRYRNASPDTLRSLYFHLYLNAFRPNSLWARNEGRERLDFQSLEEPDYGFERLRSVRLTDGPGAGTPSAPAAAEEGAVLTPSYPHAPDSTVVRFDLPEALPPDGQLTLRMRWDARPATLCRRQCRDGRSFDFAQWYPRVAVYDGGGWQAHPLYPQGEFYGEFATYDVTLDLAQDQVAGATGLPVVGDPGWRPEEGSPVAEPVLQRDHYPELEDPLSPVLLDDAAAGDRKRVRFYAEDVHHFGWSTSPDYRYEGGVYARGELPDVAIHVLYRPGDEDWDDGVAVERTIRALSWLESIFRPYPYPQLTNLHRLEGGGTEFPMVIMDGSASEGLIVHEATHQYAHGILANNEWRDAWLDEGLTSFLGSWYAEEHGGGDVWSGQMEGLGRLEGVWNRPDRRPDPLPDFVRGYLIEGDTLPAPLPVATRSEDFANYAQYGTISYSKASAVFYMLRQLVGKETMRRILRTYYDRYEFRHVNEAALRSVAEEVHGRSLDEFFDTWLHSTATLDWGVTSASTSETADGSWRTTVRVRREGEAWMPVTLRLLGSDGPARDTRIETRKRSASVEVVTEVRPVAVELDPDRQLLDADRSDNRRDVTDGG
jgi:hypothetical protein